MAALTQAIRIPDRRSDINAYKVAASNVVFFGGLVGVNAAGFLIPWGDVATNEFRGICSGSVAKGTGAAGTATLPNLPFESVDGDNVGTYGEAAEAWVDERGLILEKVTVAGSDQTDVGELIFCGTDNWNADLTVTVNNPDAVAHGTRFYSGTTMDVTLFKPDVHLTL